MNFQKFTNQAKVPKSSFILLCYDIHLFRELHVEKLRKIKKMSTLYEKHLLVVWGKGFFKTHGATASQRQHHSITTSQHERGVVISKSNEVN